MCCLNVYLGAVSNKYDIIVRELYRVPGEMPIVPSAA